MPTIGEIRLAKDIGIKAGWHKATWHACADCGKERWVLLKAGKPQNERCHPCGAKHRAKNQESWRKGPLHHNWKGGRSITVGGYVEVWVDPSHPFYAMANKDNYIFEHRLVMAEHLGRCLDLSEEVHHKNHIKTDNRIENLEIIDKRTHAFNHAKVSHLLKQIKELEKTVAEYKRRYGEL